ncbi:MAG: MarR family transcriptional regulator [Chloroflexi bacterium]|nr:MarR family transcriptional regulator [Chloroflexota bacterium]
MNSPLNDPELQADVAEMERVTLRMSWAAHRTQAQRLKEFNLTMPQFMVLRALQRLAPGCTMTELGEAAIQVPATVTGIIDRLEQNDLVNRVPNPSDRRSYHILLTSAGQALLHQIDEERRQGIEMLFQNLPVEQRKLLLSFMHSYIDAMLEEDPDVE